MTNFEDRNQSVPAEADDVDRDIAIVDRESSAARPERNPFAVVPVLLGVLLLLANLFTFYRVPAAFTARNTDGAISLLLISVSAVICLSLIAYGLATRSHAGDGSAEGRRRFVRPVALTLVLGLIAPLFTLWGLYVDKAGTAHWFQTYNKPCIEIYEQAAGIVKDVPNFRMPAGDPNEERCGVNAALGR